MRQSKAKLSARSIAAAALLALGACGGGGGGTPPPPPPPPPPPAAPVLDVAGPDIKRLRFVWGSATGATSYRLMQSADGVSAFTQVGANLAAAATSVDVDVAVHALDWANARYRLEACNTGGCTPSSPVGVANAMLQAIGYFKASNTEAGDAFGFPVALSADGGTLAVSAPNEDSGSGAQDNNDAAAAGAVYIFTRAGGSWSQQAYIKPSLRAGDAGTGDFFGFALALSADGDTLAAGAPLEDGSGAGVNADIDETAPDAGAVYVFTRAGASWSQAAYVKASNTGAGDRFGWSIALSGSGDTLAVSASNEASGATGVNSDEANDSAAMAGAVYVFSRSGDVWAQQAYIKASNTDAEDQFGWSVALDGRGETLAVSARDEDSSTRGIDGDQSDDGARDSGAVYVFARSADVWSQQAYLKASNTSARDLFGWSVALSPEGNLLAVGAPFEDSLATGVGGDESDESATDSGAAYVFNRSGRQWFQQAYLKASNTGVSDGFGSAVAVLSTPAISADTVAVGAPRESSRAVGLNGDELDDSIEAAGAVYVFALRGGSWAQRAYVKAPNPDRLDAFGHTLALSADGDALAVGAFQESSSAAGINGNQADNQAPLAGAVYLY